MNKRQKIQQEKLLKEIERANARLRPGTSLATAWVSRMGSWEVTISWPGYKKVFQFPNWDKAIRHFEEESQGVNQMELL